MSCASFRFGEDIQTNEGIRTMFIGPSQRPLNYDDSIVNCDDSISTTISSITVRELTV